MDMGDIDRLCQKIHFIYQKRCFWKEKNNKNNENKIKEYSVNVANSTECVGSYVGLCRIILAWHDRFVYGVGCLECRV